MNNFKQITSIIFCVICFHPLLKAQEVAKELRKIKEAYANNQQLSFDVSAYSYKTKTDKTPELISSGHVKKLKGSYYSSFLNYVLIMTDKKAIMIDKSEKMMDYYEYSVQDQKIPKDFQINMDSMVFGSDSIVLKPAKEGLKHFVIFDNNDHITQTEVFVDEKTNFIRRILYYYAPSTEEFEVDMDRVDIYYKNISTAEIPASFFSLDKYIKRLKGSYYGIGQYQGYKVNYYNSKN